MHLLNQKIVIPLSTLYRFEELEARADAALYSNKKSAVMRDLLSVMTSSPSEDVEYRASLKYVEMILYSQGSLYTAENLLQYNQEKNIHSDLTLKAQEDYLFGLIYYIKSKWDTRPNRMLRDRLISEGIGQRG